MDREPAACNLVGGRAATAKIDERGLRFRVYNRSLDHGLARGLQLGTQTPKRLRPCSDRLSTLTDRSATRQNRHQAQSAS
jgi:hypothetical protein